jgi:hypothetical protein
VFDDPNLVACAGLVPMVCLARSAGLRMLADEHLSVPSDKGANAGLKVASLVAGMVAGGNSAIIEQVHADLKNSALAHLPSSRFAANAAWLVLAVMAFNLTRAAATLAGHPLAKATTATIRRTLVTVPARIACSARRLTLHLPRGWPWETGWSNLFARACSPPAAATP